LTNLGLIRKDCNDESAHEWFPFYRLPAAFDAGSSTVDTKSQLTFFMCVVFGGSEFVGQ